MLEKWNVEVRLQTEMTPRLCAEIAPDVSVVATGSEIESIAIPGVQLKHVMSFT
jgi:hypothetical protein